MITELGYTIPHPTTDLAIAAQFTALELKQAVSLTTNIRNGTLVWRKVAAGAIQAPTDYDADYLLVQDLATGVGANMDRLLLGKVFSTFSTDFTATNQDFILGQGATPYIGTLPDATTALLPVTIKNIGLGDLTMVGVLGQTLDGSADTILRGGRKATMTFYPIGGNWWFA